MTANLVNYHTITWVLGSFLAALGVSMLVPYVYSVFPDHHDQTAMLLASLVTLAAAAIMMILGRERERRDLLHRIESEDHIVLFLADKRQIVDVERLFQVAITFICRI